MKKQYFWNTAAGLLNAAEGVIFGMITNRVTGMTDSGILTIAFGKLEKKLDYFKA